MENTNPEQQAHKKVEMEDRDDNKNFYDQFDRQSPLYHGGDETPVPFKDEKSLPKSMPSEYPEGFDPNAPPKPDPANDDPEVKSLAEAMGFFRDFKKCWSKVADALVARGQLLLKTEEKATFVDEKVKKEIKAADEFEEKCKKNPNFTGFDDAKAKVVTFIDNIGEDVKKGKEDSKVEITAFTRLLFKLQNEMMSKIKLRKKALKEQQ